MPTGHNFGLVSPPEVRDRDSKFSTAFNEVFAGNGSG